MEISCQSPGMLLYRLFLLCLLGRYEVGQIRRRIHHENRKGNRKIFTGGQMINPIDSIRNTNNALDFEFYMNDLTICQTCFKKKFKCPYCGAYFCREESCKDSDTEHIRACIDQNKVE